MSTSPPKKDDRLFVRDGRRSYRSTFSLTEFRLGLGVVVVLALITTWLWWKGAHPDPALFTAARGGSVRSLMARARRPHVVDIAHRESQRAGPRWTRRVVRER